MAKKESRHVKKFKECHAKDGESIIAWAEGYIGEIMGTGDKTQHNGALIVTDARVIFYRKGIFGEVLETIPLKNLTSIERKSMLGHRIIRMHASHDDLEFKTFEKDGEASLVEAIERGRHEALLTKSLTFAPLEDNFYKIRKLAELKEAGVLTEEEFAAKKEKLLSEI